MPDHAPDFIYTIYIAASADKVWNGLIDREMTKAYWGHYNESEWRQGTPWKHVRSDGSGKVDTLGEVLEIDAPNKLVVSWSFPQDADDPNKVSRVTYEITALGPDTKFTVTHAELESGSEMDSGVRKGWPAVLSNLKSLLETGKTLSDELWG